MSKSKQSKRKHRKAIQKKLTTKVNGRGMNKMAMAYFSNLKTLLTLFQVMAAFEGYPGSVILDSLEMTLFMVSRILYST